MFTSHGIPNRAAFLVANAVLILALGGFEASAQDRLKSMPGNAQYEKLSKEIAKSVKSGAIQPTWKDQGKIVEYTHDTKKYAFDIALRKEIELVPPKKVEGKEVGGKEVEGKKGKDRPMTPPLKGPARGRQANNALSPDGKILATYKDRNITLSDPKGENPKPITTDGNEKTRIKNGVASWVYGEELEQKSALWWSPQSKKLAYYRFDESKVKDFYLALDQTKLQTKLDAEAYPKVGTDNPIVELMVYDTIGNKGTKIDVRSGKPFTNDVVGHYVYNISWSKDGKELLFFRTNRLQKVMEFVAADPESGKVRVIVREEWPKSWVENLPEKRFLQDGKRFIWASQRTGFLNYYLYNLEGKPFIPLTRHGFEVANILDIDEAKGVLYYMARSGQNHMMMQLHCVSLDGTNDTRLTDPLLHHQVFMAPDFRHFVDITQTHDQPPNSNLLDASGKFVAELAKSNTNPFEKLGLKKVELFTFKSADKTTELHGLLHKPSTFDPTKKYPVLVSVYAGPETNAARETFTLPSALTEFGFLVVSLDSRSAKGRGKKFLDAIYQDFGIAEIDDQAEGVKELAKRPYVDAKRVGIHGTSYGGFASAMCLLRHPELFQAAVASSAVTDFRNYDTIYTERYLGLPTDGTKTYEKTNLMALAPKLKGRLMIFFGTADDNVHPNNALQLIQAFQKAGKSIDVQVGPDVGHAALSMPRMMEFFIETLVLGK